jgi:hypothetical protein
MADLVSRAVTASVIGLLLAIGWGRLRRRLTANAQQKLFTQEFLTKVQAFVNSRGSDHTAYSWLTERSARMQGELGAFGYLEAFHRPFQNLVYRNAPVIFTLLPELYGELNRGGLTGGYEPAIAQYQQTLQEVLIRHLGILDDLSQEIRSELGNPLLWFREGIRSLVFLPVSVLGWLGIASPALVLRVTSSMLARSTAGVLALIGLVSAAVTIVVGWEQFLAKIQALLR